MASGKLRIGTIATLVAIPLVAGGCNNAGEGLLSGAALGAGAGAIIGSLYGAAGNGAAIGAVAGGLGGAVVGDQNSRNRGGSYSSGYGYSGPAYGTYYSTEYYYTDYHYHGHSHHHHRNRRGCDW